MKDQSDEILAALANEYWEFRLREDPLMATALGDRRYDDRLPEITLEARLRRESMFASVMQRCNPMEEGGLTEGDRLARLALAIDAGAQLEYSQCRLEEWVIDPLGGPQVEFQNMESYQTVRTPVEARAMVKRWEAIGGYLDQHMANLRRGTTAGRVAGRVEVEKVIDELKELLSKPNAEWALLRPLATEHPDWQEADVRDFTEGLKRATSDAVRPAFSRYLEFLESVVLAKSRPQEQPGLVNLPGGSELYLKLIHVHTSLNAAPGELHQIGLDEVARINREMEVLGNKVFGTSERKEILRRLRTDRSLYFSSRDEVAAKAEEALSRARAALRNWFGKLPKTGCEVVRMEEHEEKHSTIAYYRPPAADGSRPGRYYINTSAPETRPRYEAEALAFHESIPGHHLQIAIAQELQGVPEFRKHSGVTAFVEGWGLYAERLSDEMGLYSSDLDKIGILSFDAWRACRLVVDTGMHAMGWTRAQAINFMMDNTALAENNIVNEVDRYIVWPGQALAYKSGQLEMIKLRRQAEERLGSRFDIRRFHDLLLGSGALPLETLKSLIDQA